MIADPENAQFPITQRYDYRLRGWSLLFTAFFLIIMGGLLLFMSIVEPDAFVGVPLAPHVGSVLYGICGVGSFVLVVMIFLRVRSQKNSDRSIRFGVNSVTLPKSLYSNVRIEILYTSIRGLKRERVSRAATNFITIEYGDTCLRLSDMGFETSIDFQAVYSQLKLFLPLYRQAKS
ncbi:hypothetical protein [Cohaesibacter celericrescens]|uniref:hypothetical protein n=1 Tax=Cohaesibacter celericrescens TaxID=2067669 RepID=UPI00356B4A2C